MAKINKGIVAISAIFILVLVLGIVYASANDNESNHSNGNGNHNNISDDNETENHMNETDDDNETEMDDDNETQMNKTRGNMTHTFLPWQKRNESECPEACVCHGAVVSCETEYGKIMTITAGNSGNVITIVVNKTEINTTLEIEQETDNETNTSKFYAKKSNGKFSEIKIMPDTAAERALERLRLKVCNESNNCTIVLKDVGQRNETDNETIAYEIQVQRHARILGIFQAKANERAEVNAENGKVQVHEPWWMFLAVKED